MKALAAALAAVLGLAACVHASTTATTTGNPAVATSAPALSAPRTPAARVELMVSTRAPLTVPIRRAPDVRAAPLRPQILSATVSPTAVGSGTMVSAVVRTTPGVVSVVAYAAGTSMPVPRAGPGLFEGSTTLPPLPPFAHGSYAVTFVARDAQGLTAQSAVGVTVR